MHSKQTNKISTVEWVKPQISDYPDSEEKRQVQNLAEKVDLHRYGIIYRINKDADFTENFMNRQEQFFELWWEFQAAMGRLKATSRRETIEGRRWIASYIVSVLAIIISIISIIIAIKA